MLAEKCSSGEQSSLIFFRFPRPFLQNAGYPTWDPDYAQCPRIDHEVHGSIKGNQHDRLLEHALGLPCRGNAVRGLA